MHRTIGSDVAIHEASADGPEATTLIAELDVELNERYPGAPVHGLRPGEGADGGA
jgi:hypothetical protein